MFRIFSTSSSRSQRLMGTLTATLFAMGFSYLNAVVGSDMLSPAHASRLGLTEAWRRQLQVPAGAQSIVDQKLHIVGERQTEYVEVSSASVDLVIKPKPDVGDLVDAVKEQEADFPGIQGQTPADAKVFARFRLEGGTPEQLALAKSEAERKARQQVRILARRGIKATITNRFVPIVFLYTLGDDGTLQCQNAENGDLIWLARFGSRNRGYGNIGVGDESISIVNGSELILVDAQTGEEINVRPMVSVPLFGAIHSGDFVLIPTIRGGIEAYPLRDTTAEPYMRLVGGQALASPTMAPGSSKVAWGTDNGFVYVLESSGQPDLIFRLGTEGIVAGKIAAAGGDRFFFGSEGGMVYSLKATRNGQVVWARPMGEPFYNEPIVYKKSVLIRSSYGTLYSMDFDTGALLWSDGTPGVDELIGCFNDRAYVRMLSGVLGVIDVKTGKIIEIVSSIQPRQMLTNSQTDRLYLIDASGTMQCLKLHDSDLPTISESMKVPQAAEASPQGTKPDASADPSMPATDPFGAGATMGTDPGAPDPFGAGAAPAGADPFGAGAADPFGN